MSNYSVNGQAMTKEEVLEKIAASDTIITKVSFSMSNESEDNQEKADAENLDLVSYLQYLAACMERMDAGYARVVLSKAKRFRNKDIVITLRDGPPKRLERVLRWANLIS